MNNIYVDELPKSCDDCKFGYFYDCQYCTLRPDLMRKDEWCEKEKHCKLLSLSDRLAEERKKVIERIRDMAEIYTEPSSKGFDFETYILTEENLNNILDKAERGSYE